MTAKQQAEKLFKSVNTFIISCVDAEGYPHTKAVVPGKIREDINEMYFCTNTSSKTAQILQSGSKASVYFYERGLFWKGCLLKGDMEIVDDIRQKEKFWQNAFRNAYPEHSYTDPDFCLLKFTAKSGRFYSNFHPQDFEV